MEKQSLPNDVKTFGSQVTTFPIGIGDAFERLVQMLPPGDERPFYGISECTREGIIYHASALEIFDGEGEKYGCNSYTIEKGDYLAITVRDWLKRTDFIKVVFEELLKNTISDPSKPCIEVYKNDEEMMCMVRVDGLKQLHNDLEIAAEELIGEISSLDSRQLNAIPFPGSWSAAQIADHIIKSNASIGEALKRKGRSAERDAGEKAEELKKIFLDFSKKFQASAFILPDRETYAKETLIADLKTSMEQVREAGKMARLDEVIRNRALGEITKLEMLYFVLYHTKRHIHQIRNIAQKLESGHAV